MVSKVRSIRNKIGVKIFLPFCLGLLLPYDTHAFVAKMENIPLSLEEYSRSVLNKVLTAYNPPLETQGAARVLVRIGRDGRPYSCELKEQVTGYEIYNAVCNAVLNVQPFERLEGGTSQAEITLVFEHDEPFRGVTDRNLPPAKSADEIFASTTSLASQALTSTIENETSTINISVSNTQTQEEPEPVEQSSSSSDDLQIVSVAPVVPVTPIAPTVPVEVYENDPDPSLPVAENEEIITSTTQTSSAPAVVNINSYTQTIKQRAEAQLLVPLELTEGTYKVQVGMMVDPEGYLLYYSVLESSGSEYADDAVVRALTADGVVPPTPDGKEHEVILDFTIVK